MPTDWVTNGGHANSMVSSKPITVKGIFNVNTDKLKINSFCMEKSSE
jgi:hypothetical protein